MASGALRTLAALACGLIFGLGLAVSGMMNPAKVIGFLDVAGDWDPTLIFVMGGALLVTVPAYRAILARQRPILDESFSLPQKKAIDAPLIWGAAPVRRRLGLGRVLPGPGGRRARHGARAGLRVRSCDGGGDGPPRLAKGLLTAPRAGSGSPPSAVHTT